MNSGYVFAPYLMADSVPVVIEGTFSLSKILNSKYASASISHRYYTKIGPRHIVVKKTLERIYERKCIS